MGGALFIVIVQVQYSESENVVFEYNLRLVHTGTLIQLRSVLHKTFLRIHTATAKSTC